MSVSSRWRPLSWYHRRADDRQRDIRRRVLRPIHALRRRAEIGVLRFEDVRHERLRIAIDQREPRALHLNADLVALHEAITLCVQIDRELFGLVRRDCFGLLEALAEAAAEDVVSDHELVAR